MLKYLEEYRKLALLLVNWRNECGQIAVLQQTRNSVYMRLASLQSCFMDLKHGQLTGIDHINLLETFHQDCTRRILNIE